jgi:hypothetical protein
VSQKNESMAVVYYIFAADLVALVFLAWLWMR